MHMKPIMEGWRGYLVELNQDATGPATDLEIAITDTINGSQPIKFINLSRAIVANLGPTQGAQKLDTAPITEFWIKNGGSNNTTKADLKIDQTGVSLKYGPSQFMSGQGGETQATAAAALKNVNVDIETASPEVKRLFEMLGGFMDKLFFDRGVGELKKYIRRGKLDQYVESINLLNERIKFQEEVQNVFDGIAQQSPEFKKQFLFEAMTGREKFGLNNEGVASKLLVIAGGNIVYNDKVTDQNFSRFMKYKKIDENLAAYYMDKTKILVKFKTDSEKIKGIKTGRKKAREVVGLMVAELPQFLEALTTIQERALPSPATANAPLGYDVEVEDDVSSMEGNGEMLLYTVLAKYDINNLYDLMKIFSLEVDERSSSAPVEYNFWQE